jgi:hypothetical protein
MKRWFLVLFLCVAFTTSGFCAYRTAYDLVSFMPDVPAASSIIRIAIVRSIILPVGLPQLVCRAKIAPSSSVTVTLNKVSGGVTTAIGTLNWTAGITTCTATFTSDIDFIDGDLVEELFPAIADTTFADVAIGLPGIRP